MSEHGDETRTDEGEVALPDTPDVDGAPDDEQAEAEEAGDDGGREPEDEPVGEEAPQARILSDVEREKRFKAADKAVATYARRIGDIYGADADDLAECPLCPSIHKGFVNVQDAGLVPDAVKSTVMTFLGYAREREYAQAPNVHACESCEALGKVATGSQVAGKETITCPRCNGYGYYPPPGAPQNGADLSHGGPHVEEFTASGAGVPDTDPAGEPRILPDGRENPNYGKWPQYKIAVEPWGKTAGLMAQDAAAG